MKSSLLVLFVIFITMPDCEAQDRITDIMNSPDYKKANSLLNTKSDSAFYLFNEIATTSKDSLKVAMAYNNMADIQSKAGDHFGSQETVTASLKHLNKKNEIHFYCLASNFNLLAVNNLNLKNYTDAISNVDSALKFNRYPQYNIIFLNNKALAYQKSKDYANAITLYEEIKEKSKSSPLDYARVVSNLARTKWLANSDYNATSEFHEALEIRTREKNDWGLNASYSHLSDYYSNTNKDSALIYASKMYEVAKKLNSPDDQLEALQKLIPLSTSVAQKNYYYATFQQLNDSLQTARNASKNQFAVFRFNAEQSKAENLQLQQENSEKSHRIAQQRLMIYGIVAATLIILTIAALWYRKRKQIIHWETQNAIRENQLKTSKKVHDVVANGLYQVMKELEYKEQVEKNSLLDRIENLYEQSRDISYEDSTPLSGSFSDNLYSLLTSFISSTTNIFTVGTDDVLWTDISPRVKKDLKYVLQELMVNMSKHSQAHNVVINFKQEDGRLHILYKDDGIGFPAGLKFGNGLKNTENRITGIGGQIIFSSEQGLKIDISIPTSNPHDR